MENRECETCVHADFRNQGGFGLCRRNAPGRFGWFRIVNDDWCSQWLPEDSDDGLFMGLPDPEQGQNVKERRGQECRT